MLSIGKKFTFDAAHFIEGHQQCGQMHGHTWKLEVALNGCCCNEHGMVIDFHVLSGIVKDVLKTLDHKVINVVVGFVPVTAETLVEHLCCLINHNIQQISPETRYRSITCQLQEGEGGWAAYHMEVE